MTSDKFASATIKFPSQRRRRSLETMPITMSGSPTGYASPGGSPTGKTGSPLSRKEAEKSIGWVLPGRSYVMTKGDAFYEEKKQWHEKEVRQATHRSKQRECMTLALSVQTTQFNDPYPVQANRDKLLEREAREMHDRAMKVHQERELWKSRQRAREDKEKHAKDFKSHERQLALEEWKERSEQEPGHGLSQTPT